MMANQFLGLSLFIMLLSFFIILNSLSNFDEYKAAPVLNSLSEAFSKKDERLIKAGQIPSSRKSNSKGTTISQINDLFQSHISGVEMRQNRLGTELRLRLSLKEFEQEVMSSVGGASLAGKGFFLGTLVSLLDTQNEGEMYKMDMVVYLGDDYEIGRVRRNSAKQMAEIAKKIEAAGVPRKMMSAGFGGGPDGIVDIYFRPYRAFDSERFQDASKGGQNE